MPTPSEQKALAFVAIAVLLGGVVRVLRAGSPVEATAAEQQALARQATAADSASAAQRSAKPQKARKARMMTLKYRDTVARVVGGVASVPPSSWRSPGAGTPETGAGDAATRPGFPPPGPRVDTDVRRGAGAGAASPATGFAGRRGAPPSSTDGPALDLDQATEADIDRLPRVGPALARRIVANRDSLGPFGSLAALRRVKGVGPATLDRLAPLVTFSGRAAPRAPPD